VFHRNCWLTLVALGVAAPLSGQTSAPFSLTSTDVHAGGSVPLAQVFNGMGCTGKNLSPALEWKGAPAGAKSFAVTVYDPDAPTGSGFWHWVVFNLPGSTTRIATGAGDPARHLMPAGATQNITDFGKPGYGGPCPPAGDKPHHYVFTVYALDVPQLDIPAGSTPAFVGFNIHGHTMAKATFTATYGR
jgi:Raf kinase inhibitor-like YbhB/YbcL family protein